jgi:uroporphyrinogen-III synthase
MLQPYGAQVDKLTVYDSLLLVDDEHRRPLEAAFAKGVDMAVFNSPSAVEAFSRFDIHLGAAHVACIGPTTSEAALRFLQKMDIQAESYTLGGLAMAIRTYYGSAHA